MPVEYVNNYPNIIIFAANNPDGIIASYLIKNKYDNNLQNDLWDRNVHVYLTEKNQSVKDYYNKIEQKIVKDQKNIIFLINANIDSNSILKLWNWTIDREVDFVWLDNNIEIIQLIKYLNIPGKQNSRKATATLTWQYLNNNQAIPKFLQIFEQSIINKKEYTFSKEKESIPLNYFIQSLGNALNDNTNDLLIQNLNKIISDEEFLTQAIQVGKFIYNYVKLNNIEDNKAEN